MGVHVRQSIAKSKQEKLLLRYMRNMQHDQTNVGCMRTHHRVRTTTELAPKSSRFPPFVFNHRQRRRAHNKASRQQDKYEAGCCWCGHQYNIVHIHRHQHQDDGKMWCVPSTLHNYAPHIHVLRSLSATQTPSYRRETPTSNARGTPPSLLVPVRAINQLLHHQRRAPSSHTKPQQEESEHMQNGETHARRHRMWRAVERRSERTRSVDHITVEVRATPHQGRETCARTARHTNLRVRARRHPAAQQLYPHRPRQRTRTSARQEENTTRLTGVCGDEDDSKNKHPRSGSKGGSEKGRQNGRKKEKTKKEKEIIYETHTHPNPQSSKNQMRTVVYFLQGVQ
ncbi:hypothetical protein C8F04DRAFT_1193333 [Mycena alexandri]|uniref:Uncharacterized protein n=1 Tax=Mycena alexandri TaxID=1745969 RepID=A0AAD6S9W3_9AGAR|nr:hypothetical protein C8F04DRAFT_1193333 [Mycena alexandri]